MGDFEILLNARSGGCKWAGRPNVRTDTLSKDESTPQATASMNRLAKTIPLVGYHASREVYASGENLLLAHASRDDNDYVCVPLGDSSCWPSGLLRRLWLCEDTSASVQNVPTKPPLPLQNALTKKAASASVQSAPTKKAVAASMQSAPTKKAAAASMQSAPTKKAAAASVQSAPTKKAAAASVQSAPTKKAASASVQSAPTKKAASASVQSAPTKKAASASVQSAPTKKAASASVQSATTKKAASASVQSATTKKAASGRRL
ncbi:hypothetical protein EDC01DRAFT_626988 [Geopyxis carbonaria]|nr:hypothetical protein EDC01DRAFT_626988 [Geopyxis carbonaria]